MKDSLGVFLEFCQSKSCPKGCHGGTVGSGSPARCQTLFSFMEKELWELPSPFTGTPGTVYCMYYGEGPRICGPVPEPGFHIDAEQAGASQQQSQSHSWIVSILCGVGQSNSWMVRMLSGVGVRGRAPATRRVGAGSPGIS